MPFRQSSVCDKLSIVFVANKSGGNAIQNWAAVNVKLGVHLGWAQRQIRRNLELAWGGNAFSPPQVRMWYQHFTVDQNASCKDKPHTGCPRSLLARSPTNVQLIQNAVDVDHRWTVKELAQQTGVFTEYSARIFTFPRWQRNSYPRFWLQTRPRWGWSFPQQTWGQFKETQLFLTEPSQWMRVGFSPFIPTQNKQICSGWTTNSHALPKPCAQGPSRNACWCCFLITKVQSTGICVPMQNELGAVLPDFALDAWVLKAQASSTVGCSELDSPPRQCTLSCLHWAFGLLLHHWHGWGASLATPTIQSGSGSMYLLGIPNFEEADSALLTWMNSKTQWRPFSAGLHLLSTTTDSPTSDTDTRNASKSMADSLKDTNWSSKTFCWLIPELRHEMHVGPLPKSEYLFT